jgi:hypothetical protein
MPPRARDALLDFTRRLLETEREEQAERVRASDVSATA